jgi:phage terminase small subunit
MNNAVAKIPDERESFGPCMLACRPDEREFVLHVIAGKSNAEAAKLAGWGEAESSAATLARIGHRLAHRERIIAAIGEEVKKLTRSRATLKAAQAIDEILDNSYHRDRARVALAVLERVDPTIQKHEVEVTHKIDHEQEALDQLRSLRALNVAREKLIELYGAFGLERLEKKLAIENKGSVVDAEFSEVDPDADLLGE